MTAAVVETETVPAVRRTRLLLIILGSLSAIGPLSIDMYLPALPKIADDLSVSSSVVQLTLTGTLVGLALGQCCMHRGIGCSLRWLCWGACCCRRPR